MVTFFTIPNGILPNSKDPVHTDQFNNYFPAQMIYTTPLIINERGELDSLVLSEFRYEKNNRTILFKTGKSFTFTDGSLIEAEDIAFAIVRMLFMRPEFPVIKYIKGKAKWLKSEYPLESLPKGISINGDCINIELERDVYNPLFRFTMTIMSIIPKKCVDLKENSINIKDIPGSGIYQEIGRSTNSIEYKLREDLSFNNEIPSLLTFKYPQVTSVISYIDIMGEDEVIFAHDLDFNSESFEYVSEKFDIRRLDPVWFFGFVLNPNLPFFKDLWMREIFISTMHQFLRKQTLAPQEYSKSLFSRLIPGSLSEDAFEFNNFSEDDINKFKQKVKGHKFSWAIRKSNPPKIIYEALQYTCKFLTLDIDLDNPEVAKGSHSGWESYSLDNILLHTTYSGFWPLDAVGDIQMLFTPNMHSDYQDIWGNDEFMTLIDGLGLEMNIDGINEKMKEVNLKLFELKMMSIVSHQSYSYISKKPKGLSKFSLTVPYPWQVF